MRVTTWNCSRGAGINRYLTLLDPLRPDLVTLQECRKPKDDIPSVVWRGTADIQGIAVVIRDEAVSVEAVNIPGLHPTIVPVVVHSPNPFMFVGVWTHKPYNDVAYRAMASCVAAAEGLPIIAAGDFNSSPRVVGQEQSSPDFVRRMREEFGLVSAYHHYFGSEHGQEPDPTYFHNWKEAAPLHIDYCFVPEGWAERVRSVKVGSYSEWPDSDHRPLTMEIAQ